MPDTVHHLCFWYNCDACGLHCSIFINKKDLQFDSVICSKHILKNPFVITCSFLTDERAGNKPASVLQINNDKITKYHFESVCTGSVIS